MTVIFLQSKGTDQGYRLSLVKIRDMSGLMSQPAGGAAKGFGACSIEIVEKQAQECAILVFLNVLELVSGIHFKHIFS